MSEVPGNVTLYRVAWENENGSFQGVLVAASRGEEAKTLGLPYVEYGDEEEGVTVVKLGVTAGPVRALVRNSDDPIYRAQGWAEDADEDGPCSTSCDTCGLHPYQSIEESKVCSWCAQCLECAQTSSFSEPCKECGEPKRPLAMGAQ